jgi:molybdenum cofactor cytidylyltransferase
MKFGPIPVQQAAGKVLAHNVPHANRRGAFRKGRPLTWLDVEALLKEGYDTVYTAELEPGDLDEDQAACRVAEAVTGEGLALLGASEGRVNLIARMDGVLRVDAERLERVNLVEGVAIASQNSWKRVARGQIAAVVKIVPYGLPFERVEQAVQRAEGPNALIEMRELTPRRIGLLAFGQANRQENLLRSFRVPLEHRAERIGSHLEMLHYVPMSGQADEARLAEALTRLAGLGMEMIILAGETSTMDWNDLTPRALAQAGGEVVCVGAPLEPGNLLTLAYLGEVPVLGVPGCARSHRENGIDRMLPALLAGYRLGRADIARLGYGGLIAE